MNQTQRKFLIDKIEKSAKTQRQALENSMPQPPSLNNYLLHAVMSNNFEIKNTEELKEMIRQMALKAKDRDDWMGNHWGSASKSNIHFKASEFFIVPEEYKILANEYRIKSESIRKQMYDLDMQVDGLITRIQLASDKTLQTMINEVDDMGNISLFDTKLKELTIANIKSIDK